MHGDGVETERRILEQGLGAAGQPPAHERELRTIVDSVRSRLLLLDRDERIRLANPRAVQLMGVSSDAIIGQRLLPERLPFGDEQLSDALRPGGYHLPAHPP